MYSVNNREAEVKQSGVFSEPDLVGRLALKAACEVAGLC